MYVYVCQFQLLFPFAKMVLQSYSYFSLVSANLDLNRRLLRSKLPETKLK